MKLTPTDKLLMVLAAAVIALLSVGILMRPAESKTGHDARATVTDPAQTPCVDAVALAVTPSPTAEHAPTPEPDKPACDPAVPLPEELQIVLRDACEEYGVELAMALGVIEVESGFKPDIVNPISGCYGLMQLNPRYFPADLPHGENIRQGVAYLGQLLERYGDEAAALTAYNAGHDTGSRKYAGSVLAAAEKWRGA